MSVKILQYEDLHRLEQSAPCILEITNHGSLLGKGPTGEKLLEMEFKLSSEGTTKKKKTEVPNKSRVGKESQKIAESKPP